MGQKIKGAEFNAFYDTGWSEGFWHEDSGYEIEDDSGNRLIKADDILDIGNLGWLQDGRKEISFEDAFLAWQKGLNGDRIMVIHVPGEHVAAVEDFLSGLGILPVDPDESESISPES